MDNNLISIIIVLIGVPAIMAIMLFLVQFKNERKDVNPPVVKEEPKKLETPTWENPMPFVEQKVEELTTPSEEAIKEFDKRVLDIMADATTSTPDIGIGTEEPKKEE
jgi:hypothetical protein